MADTRTVLCIPGPWDDRGAFIRALMESACGYLFAGGILMEMTTQQGCTAQFEGPDEAMAAAFRSASPHWRDAPEQAAIASHRSVIYLIDEGGSRERAEALMAAAAALIKAGGLGVKVESTGLAHSPAQWLELADNTGRFSAYRAYVVTITGGAEIHTCGMQNFGMHDVRVDASEPDAADLATQFSWYLFTQTPQLESGHTFSVDVDAPRYRVEAAEPVDYPPDSLFANPYGTWRLERAD
ncbi:hypothetical protein ACFWP0_17540 [Achromobacter sp. NPDC058515]|uniref:hypothetical protein n=1 Tax=Achromobacter sp. NPDC058515 TaxID=3346533 RepID=UPI00364A87B7